MIIKRHMLDFIKGTYSLIDDKFDFCFNDRSIWGMRNESRDAILDYNLKVENPGQSYRFHHKAPFTLGMDLVVKDSKSATLVSPAFKSVSLPLLEASELPKYQDFDSSEFTEMEKLILSMGNKVTASRGTIASSNNRNMIFAAKSREVLGFSVEIPPKADKFNISRNSLELEFTAEDYLLKKKISTEPVAYEVNDLPGGIEVFPDVSSIKEALNIIPQIALAATDRITLKPGKDGDQLEMNTSYGVLGIGMMFREKPSERTEFHVSKDGLMSFLGFVLRNTPSEFPGTIEYNNGNDTSTDKTGYFVIKMKAGYNGYAF